MPTIKVELLKGRDLESLIELKNNVMQSVVDALQLLPDDKNIRILEYQPELFQMKSPYKILIEISLFIGRTKETKKKLYQLIVNNLEKANIAKKEEVFIILNALFIFSAQGRRTFVCVLY